MSNFIHILQELNHHIMYYGYHYFFYHVYSAYLHSMPLCLKMITKRNNNYHIDGLVQEIRNSIAYALELRFLHWPIDIYFD